MYLWNRRRKLTKVAQLQRDEDEIRTFLPKEIRVRAQGVLMIVNSCMMYSRHSLAFLTRERGMAEWLVHYT